MVCAYLNMKSTKSSARLASNWESCNIDILDV